MVEEGLRVKLEVYRVLRHSSKGKIFYLQALCQRVLHLLLRRRIREEDGEVQGEKDLVHVLKLFFVNFGSKFLPFSLPSYHEGMGADEK